MSEPARIDRTLATLDENLALDEALLLAAEAGEAGESLRFWEWPAPAVVLGAGGSVEIDVNEAACRADEVPVHRRASGGGTVLLGPGCLLFSLVLSYERAKALGDVTASYRWILGRVREALRPLAVEHVGISDLAVGGLKVSGNAQQRKARHVLHHGTLLYAFDLPQVGRYLNVPEREPGYRAGRPHEAFVTNLPAPAGDMKEQITAVFGAGPGDADERVLRRVPGLIAEKYGRAEWVRRR
ncbi:MAG TPA: lipoate--protein ligase family protein [Gemmataceae bacterium]|jgi:lipoate-protein ligase A|nr:lipoate--protein ligase family protein [Gemmataceae bacterium]